MHTEHRLSLPGAGSLTLGRTPLVMGILNVTPDSFSDGGAHVSPMSAVARAFEMSRDGADIIDVGGESTRPNADEVPVQVELDRVVPVLEALSAIGQNAKISIDTYKALVADQAIQSGAVLINDVYGLQRDPEMAAVAVLHGTPVIAMHWDKARDRSKPIVDEMRRWFDRTIEIAEQAGLVRGQLVLDPGFGFAKTLAENYLILRDLPDFYPSFPVLVGASRKSMIGKVLNNTSTERLAGSIAATVLAYQRGAHIFRCHDVKPNRDALLIAQATIYGPPDDEEH